jgi:purine-cytosine permease-like protein
LNIVQLLGWTTFELVTISTALRQITDVVPRWVWVLVAGLLTTALSLRPLGWIRVLRRYVTVLVVVALVYLGVQLLRNPLPEVWHGSWNGFWIALDTVVGAAVSFVPVASDYSRHSRTVRAAVTGSFVGYGITQIACYAIGMITLLTVAHGHVGRIFGAFMAVPLGTLAFAVVVVREVDQSFVDNYSTAVSVQNLRQTLDRRALALVVGVFATVLGLVLNIEDYGNFLLLIGGVFVPLLGVFVVDWFAVSRGRWDLSERARSRPAMLVPWLLGFVAYQMVNPGYIAWWVRMWDAIDRWLGFAPPSWLGASLFSFAVAAAVTLPIGLATARRTPSASRTDSVRPDGAPGRST